MTREAIFELAYRVVKAINSVEQKQEPEYIIAMWTAELAEEISSESGDVHPYIERLLEEKTQKARELADELAEAHNIIIR